MHYQRMRKYGNLTAGNTHAPPDERFWRGVARGEPAECWMYERGKGRGIYGLFQSGGKGSPSVGAHRYSYELHYGKIPDGLFVCHHCDTPRCVNPEHLFLGTARDNTADMVAKGRARFSIVKGEDNGKSVLTEDDARHIKRSMERTADLARQLGVSPNTVRGVRIGRTWRHVA